MSCALLKKNSQFYPMASSLAEAGSRDKRSPVDASAYVDHFTAII